MAEGSRITRDDKFDIAELITRYNHAIDDGDPDALADCFIEGGVFEGRAGVFDGLDRIRELGMTVTPTLKPRHITYNILIDAKADEPHAATVKSHLFFYEVLPEGLNFRMSGLYTDVVVRTPKGWKFRSRLLKPDWAQPMRT